MTLGNCSQIYRLYVEHQTQKHLNNAKNRPRDVHCYICLQVEVSLLRIGEGSPDGEVYGDKWTWSILESLVQKSLIDRRCVGLSASFS